MDKVDIYIHTNFKGRADTGKGAYCFTLAFKSSNKDIITRIETKGYINTTLNRIYLYALINALKRMKKKCEIKIYANCNYLKGALNLGRMVIWKSQSWLENNEPRANADLLKELDQVLSSHEVTVCNYKQNMFASRMEYEVSSNTDFIEDRRARNDDVSERTEEEKED